MPTALLLFVALALTVTGCGEPHEKKAEREQVAREEKEGRAAAHRANLLAELQKKYGADAEWAKRPVAWTIDLQERLILPDSRPIAGMARLRDVEKRANSHILHLIPDPFGSQRVEFFLKSDQLPRRVTGQAGVEWLLGDQLAAMSYPEYVFVARVLRVTRRDISFDREGAIDTRPQWRAEGELLSLREIVPEPSPPGSQNTYGR